MDTIDRQSGSGPSSTTARKIFALRMAIMTLYVCVVLWGSYHGLSQLHQDLIGQRGAHLARTAATMVQTLEAYVHERVGELQLLANYPGIRDAAPDSAAESLHQYIRLSKHFSAVRIVGPDVATIAATDAAGAAPPSPAWLRQVQQNGRPSLLPPQSPNGGVVTVAIPVSRIDGRRSRVLSGTIPVETIHHVLHKHFVVHAEASQSRNWLVLDPLGIVVTEHPARAPSVRDLRELKQTSVLQASRTSLRGGQFVEEIDARTQVPVVTGFARLGDQDLVHAFGWTVLVQADRDGLYGPVHRFLWVVGIAFAILAAGLGYIGVGALQSLIGNVDRQGSGRRSISGPTYYDAVTGLPGDRLFEMIMSQAFERVSPSRRRMALLMFDLKQLKIVSDSHGKARGDLAVRVLAARVKSCIRMADTVARLGADRFAVLFENLSAPEDAAALAQKILRTVVLPLTLGSEEILVDTSIGVALYPSDAAAPKPLMTCAEQAMHAAQKEGVPISFYTQAQGEEIFQALASDHGGRSLSPEGPGLAQGNEAAGRWSGSRL